jgi:predicted RNA-binding protein with RPS1 domain
MGGLAAKDRRRTKRQQDPKPAVPHRAVRAPNKHGAPTKNWHSKKDFGSKDATTVVPKKKANHKPKHLKRKIETANDAIEEERLLQELKALEQAKNERQQRHVAVSKPQDVKKQTSTATIHDRTPKKSKIEASVAMRTEPVVSATKQPAANEKKSNQPAFAKKMDTPSRYAENANTPAATAIQKPDKHNPKTDTSELPNVAKNITGDRKNSNRSEQTATIVLNAEITEQPTGTKELKPAENVETPKQYKVAAKKIYNSNPNESDSDSDDNGKPDVRQRGKRRRGRKETSTLVSTTEKEAPLADKVAPSSDVNDSTDPSIVSGAATKENSESKQRKLDERRCLGRKPVTDFTIGSKYSGSVVYVKPFGVFFDIGCHSDAFCHVSRLQDDYCESAEQLFQPGNKLDGIRVVEIDRRKKRITVSLQSDAKMMDEQKSIEARLERKQKWDKSKPKTAPKLDGESPVSKSSHDKVSISVAPPKTKVTVLPVVERKEGGFASKSESEMTPQELKRHRKLARRAERREQQEGQKESNQ